MVVKACEMDSNGGKNADRDSCNVLVEDSVEDGEGVGFVGHICATRCDHEVEGMGGRSTSIGAS